VATIREAMEECLDLDRIIVYQHQKNESEEQLRKEYRLHRQWHQTTGNTAVASIPLHTDTGCAAIISLRRDTNLKFTKEELEKIRQLTEPFAAAFEMVDKAHRNLLEHAVHSVRQTASSILKPQGWKKKIAAVCAVIMIGWFCWGSMDYQITVSGTIVPEEVRYLAAPFSGTLQSAPAVQGDHVARGDVLCIFDHQELLSEREKLTAQIEIAQLEEDKALTSQQEVDAQLAQAQKRLLQAKFDIINQKIDHAVIKAPFDGLVARGDLRQRIGGVLQQGEPIYEVTSTQQWILELEVPENMTDGLVNGLSGKFASNAKPELTHELQIVRISPKAEVRNGKNVYVSEAEINLDSEWVKSGMEGAAKINIGRRRVWWIALHRMVNYARMKFWL
jgi:multidrug resistance efflux pump